jgi:glycosyltransferase involved in cell wall biosynthesis
MARYKLLLVTDTLGNGGLERQIALLAKYLPSDWECRVWSLGEGPYALIIRNTGTPVEVCPRAWRFDFTPAVHLWRLILEWRPNVVHSWGWMASFAALLPCKVLKIPLVDGTIRMGMTTSPSLSLSRFGMRMADVVVANSQAGLNACGVDSRNGRVVYNGFDPDRLVHCVAQPKYGPDIHIVMTGRMELWAKDYSTLFEAARRLRGLDGPKCHFLAVGNGVHRDILMQEAKDLVDSGIASFPEGGLEVLTVVNRAHIGVLLNPPTHAEGCSNSIMEYMACGLPVVCNDLGGNRELVVDGETGFLIPRGDSQVLLDRLRCLVRNPQVCSRLGDAGKRRLQQHFTVDTMVNAMLGIYREAFDKRKTVPAARRIHQT